MSAEAPPLRVLEKIASTCWSVSPRAPIGLSLWTYTASMSMLVWSAVGS
jgi:hypothetical protein